MLRIPAHRPPTHPGEMLVEEFLKPLGISRAELARRTLLPVRRVSLVAQEKRGITPDTALRFARFFGTSPEFWMNGQMMWDMYQAMHSPAAREIEKIEPLQPADAA